MLCGCAPAADTQLADKLGQMADKQQIAADADDTKSSGQEVDKTVKKPTPRNSKKKKEDKADRKDIIPGRDRPELYRRSKGNYSYDEEAHRPVVTSTFQLLKLSELSKKEYPELAMKLIGINDLLATEESNAFMARERDINSLPDDEKDRRYEFGTLPFIQNTYLYVRRLDDEVLSFYRSFEAQVNPEYLRRRYTSFNIDVKTGKDLTLDDIVDDRDALCELLAPKIIEAVKIQQTYDQPYDVSTEDVIKELKDHLSSGEANFVLEPQGITFLFNSESFVLDDTAVCLLFAEDEDGTVFNARFADNAPKEWVMEIPMYRHTFADLDDDGEADDICAYAQYDHEYDYDTGLCLSINGTTSEYDFEDEVYDHNIKLVHRDGRTYVIYSFDSFDFSYLQTFDIDGDDVIEKTLIGGEFTPCPVWDEDADSDNRLPSRIPADPRFVSVTADTNLLSTLQATAVCELNDDGELEPVESVYFYSPEDPIDITLKEDLPDVPVISENTHEPTGSSMLLQKGTRLILTDTDIDSFVDCRTDDGDLVRINVILDNDMGYIVRAGQESVSIWDMFDGMVIYG